MLRVVTSRNSEIFGHLGGRALQAIGIEHTVATNYRTALELIRTKHPHVVIFDAEVESGSGYELCRAVKADSALDDVRFIIVLSVEVTREKLELLDDCGCDDVLALPVSPGDFFHHVVQMAGLPHRRFERIDVSFDVEVESRGHVFEGEVDNISLGGIGLHFSGDLPDGQLVTVRLIQDDTSYPPARATVAWTRRIDKENTVAGLSFAEMPVATRMFVEELCLYDVKQLGDGQGVLVTMHGDFVETTDFSELAERLRSESRIDFNLREVHRMSSSGVHSWCMFLGELAGKEYTFRHASTTFASQVAMIPSVAGNGRFMSFETPYRCDNCDQDDIRLLETKALLREGEDVVPPRLHCSVCGGELTFDDLPWRYFSFIVRQRDWPSS